MGLPAWKAPEETIPSSKHSPYIPLVGSMASNSKSENDNLTRELSPIIFGMCPTRLDNDITYCSYPINESADAPGDHTAFHHISQNPTQSADRELFFRRLQFENAILQSRLRQLEVLIGMHHLRLRRADKEVEHLRTRFASYQGNVAGSKGARAYYEVQRANRGVLHGSDPAHGERSGGKLTRADSVGGKSVCTGVQVRTTRDRDGQTDGQAAVAVTRAKNEYHGPAHERDYEMRVRLSRAIIEGLVEARRSLGEEFEEFLSMEDFVELEEPLPRQERRARHSVSGVMRREVGRHSQRNSVG